MWKGCRKSLLGIAITSLCVVGCGGAPAFSLGPPSTVLPVVTFRIPTPRPDSLVGTFNGDGAQQTDTFTTRGGDYVVDWTARGDCFFGAFLEQDDGDGQELVANVSVTGSESGTTTLHDIPAGRWYFSTSTNCAWTLSIHG